MSIILEDSRSLLLSRGRAGQAEKDGKTRYQKRMKSKISSSTREFNQMDMDKLFKKNILDVHIPVKGETGNYIVSFSFGGLLDKLHDEVERENTGKISLRAVIRAVVGTFNSDNVYIRCTCEDFRYRGSYWASKTNIIFGDKELRSSDITNPDNKLGPGCKHIMLCLSNTSWAMKVAAVIKNYIEYMEKRLKSMYSKIIYPAIWKKPYEEPVQQSIFDTDDLESSIETIDKANVAARQKGRFTTGNEYRFQPKDRDEQITVEDELEDE